MGMNARFPVNPAKKLALPTVDDPDGADARAYVARRQPFLCRADARWRWDLDHIKRRVGDVPRTLKRVGTDEQVTISTAELLDMILQDPGWKSRYLPVEGAGAPLDLRHAPYRVLLDDVTLPSYIGPHFNVLVMLRNSRANEKHEFYDTPCHYEFNVQPAMYVQTLGKKHLWLFSPAEGANLAVESFMTESPYVSNGAEACAHPDRYPQLANATCYEVVLEPGDLVYWPEFWFHWFVHHHDLQMNIRIDWDQPTFALDPMSASWAFTNALAASLGGFRDLAKNFAALPEETRSLLVKIEQTLINEARVLEPLTMTRERMRAGLAADQTAYEPPKPAGR